MAAASRLTAHLYEYFRNHYPLRSRSTSGAQRFYVEHVLKFDLITLLNPTRILL